LRLLGGRVCGYLRAGLRGDLDPGLRAGESETIDELLAAVEAERELVGEAGGGLACRQSVLQTRLQRVQACAEFHRAGHACAAL
ncbi:hypothetical protein RZS08_40580, partial [Arthrospira platensis SPKY1]|nr:hypothetical protein [Arthrospira platensis SPKY1]